MAIEASDIVGTYRLISSKTKILDTNEVNDSNGDHPTGWISYEKNGRFSVITASNGRVKRETQDKITNEDIIKLFNTFYAYAGTYTFDGKTVTHKIDTSWNEAWTGTEKLRDVEAHGNQLIYTTKPQISAAGKMVVLTLVWEKVP